MSGRVEPRAKRPDSADTRRTGSRWAALPIASSAAGIFGIYTSFRYHFAAWGLDPDSLQAGLLWLGIREHGLPFLKTYAFGPDNWLFTLILPTLPVWDLIGPRPIAIVGLGWIAFLAVAIMAGAVANIFAGRVVGLVVAAFVLLSNAQAIGIFGFLSHPSSHDLSFCWGLAVFLLFYAWQARGNRTAFVAALVLLTADGLSDPWAVVAVTLPSLAAALICLASPAIRIRSGFCAGGIALAIALTQSRFLGLLSFLPSSPFVFAGWETANANFVSLSESLGVILNPVPGIRSPFPLAVTVAGACAALSSAWGSFALLRAVARDGARLWLAVTVILSAVLPPAAFILSTLPADFMAGRFAVSLVVLLPVIALSARTIDVRRTSAVIRYGIPAFFVLVVLSSVSGGAPLWFSRWRGITTDDVPPLVSFLREHDLRYGYGEYWGAHANAVTVVSDGEITIRPVAFDPLTGHVSRRGDSSLWYGPDSIPDLGGRFFIAFTDDGENCRSIRLCEAGVQQQFGPAEARYLDGPVTILVWSKPIIVR